MAGIAPSDAEVIRGAIKAALAEVFTATVGKIKEYDPETQTANVIPMMKRAFNVGFGVVDYEDLPVIANVPVVFPRAGGFFITFPVQPDDHVLLVFTHDDIANWRETGEPAEPDDLRRHSLGSCVAFVGMAEMSNPIPPADPITDPLEPTAREDGLVIGKEGSTQQIQWNDEGIKFGRASVVPPGTWVPAAPVVPPGTKVGTPESALALAQPVDDAIAQLKAEITALNLAVAALAAAQAAGVASMAAANSVFASHVHVCAAPASPCAATATPMAAPAPAAPPPAPVGPPAITVASTLVKAI